MSASNQREKRPRNPNEPDLYIDSKRSFNYNSSNSGSKHLNYSNSHDGIPRSSYQRSGGVGSGSGLDSSRSSRVGRTPDHHSLRRQDGHYNERYDGSTRSRNTSLQTPVLGHRSSSTGSSSDYRPQHTTPSSSSKFSSVGTPQSDRKPPSSNLMLSRSVSADIIRKPPLPQRSALPDSHSSEQLSVNSTTPSRQPPPLLSRSVSTPTSAGQKSPSSSPRSSRPFKTSRMSESLVATLRDYMKMMDYSCFTSLQKLGIDRPTQGFVTLREVFEQVDNERIAAVKQAGTPAQTSTQKSRSSHEKSSGDATYNTPVSSSRKLEDNTRTPDSGHTVQSQGQPQVVRKRASRFSDGPPPLLTAPHAR